MMKGPVREVIPIARQVVRIRPTKDGRKVARARRLVAGGEIPFSEQADAVIVELPGIDVHEVIALDLES